MATWIELSTPYYQALGLCWIIKDRKHPSHTVQERSQEQEDPSDHFLQLPSNPTAQSCYASPNTATQDNSAYFGAACSELLRRDSSVSDQGHTENLVIQSRLPSHPENLCMKHGT